MFLYIQTLPEEGLEIGKAFIWCGGTEGIMDLQLATTGRAARRRFRRRVHHP